MRLIDADVLPEISLFGTTEYINVIKAPTVPVVPLDRIKEAREEVANYSDFHREHLYKTNPNYDVEQGQYLAYEKCLQIIDDMIAEVEGTK